MDRSVICGLPNRSFGAEVVSFKSPPSHKASEGNLRYSYKRTILKDGLPTVAQEDPEGLRGAKVGGGGGSRTPVRE